MPVRVVPTAYGPAATACLHRELRRVKGGDPLAPVTVVVPTNPVAVAARRQLASGTHGPLTPGGAGVVGVSFLTVWRLAELLGAPRCAAAGRRPVSTPIVTAAVRQVLARAPGMFAPVAAHPATEEALVAAHHELSALDDAQLDVLAGRHARAREVVRLHRAVRAALRDRWYDEAALMAEACAAVRAGTPVLRDVGAVVCFLPQRLSAPAARLVRMLAERVGVTVVAGLTGVARADAAVVAGLARLGAKLDDATNASVVPAVATRAVSASDPDDEVRTIVRDVVEAMRAGVPLEQMAVLYGADDPYARLVHEHLDAAGIPHNGGSVRTLADAVAGRALLRMLRLHERDFRRDELFAFVACAPIRDGRGRLVPGAEWDRVSRRAGVVGGLDEWRARLDAYAAACAAGGDDVERRRAEALRAFVAELGAAFDPAARPRSWRAYARWAHRLLRRFVGTDAQRSGWPRLEQDAARGVEAALDRLAGLDAVDGAPSLDVFSRTLELELAGARERVGQLGDGLLAGPAGLALGVELERVWVCGLAEGVVPSVPADDPLLADAERAALDGELRLRAEHVDDLERAFLAALAATRGSRVCTWPRGDLRRSTEHVPSRFLLPSLAVLEPDAVQEVPSFAAGVAAAGFPPTRQELGVRAALAGERWIRAVPAVGRARELLAARAAEAFTRFDGNLGALGERLAAVSPWRRDGAIAPTRLELWATCPHAYFMRTILHVDVVERPEEIVQLSPLDRGTIVHEVLDAFLSSGARDRDRLHRLVDDACGAAERRGITGKRLLWERDRRLLHAELDAFFDADERWRAEHSVTTLATELPFGLDGAPVEAVELAWPDGRRLRLRGKADRVDRRADGTLVVVDYKTGSPDPYLALRPGDPVLGGTRLQLPVYAHAARGAYGAAGDDRPVEAYYWFVGRGNDRTVGYAVDEAVDATFRDTVRAIVDGIEAGVFVANPPPPGPRPFVECVYCDPDGMGTAERWREWERKYGAPELDGYRALLEGDDGDEDDA
jgi:RecB family exonuclease